MLLCLSSRQWRSVFEEAVEAAGEVALEAAVCFASCLAFVQASFDVRDRIDRAMKDRENKVVTGVPAMLLCLSSSDRRVLE